MILFDDEQVIGLFCSDQVEGGIVLRVHRIRSDDRAFQRQRIEQLRQFGNLVGLLFHVNLADDNGFLVQDRAQQMASPLASVVTAAQAFPIVGVAAFDAASGAEVEITTQGVFELPKVPTDVIAQGDKLYRNSALSQLTKTAGTGSKPLVGYAAVAAGNGTTTVRCALLPTMQKAAGTTYLLS